MLVMARPNMAEKSFWDTHAKVVSTSFGTHTQSFGTHTQSGHIHSGTHTRMLSQVHSSHQSVKHHIPRSGRRSLTVTL